MGFYRFYRLYVLWAHVILKNIAAFITNYGHTTPLQLYNSVDISLPVSQRHEMWLQKVRQAVCNRIVNEEDRVPTYTSLWRHWLRSSWIHQMWQRSPHQDVYSTLPEPEQSGWKKNGNNYTIDWEATEVMEKIKGTIHFLTKGCSCKKGCKTNNCGCKRKSSHCGPGCVCQGCMNLPQEQSLQQDDLGLESSSSSSSSNDASDANNNSSGEELEMEVVTDEFLFDQTTII